MDTCLTNRSNRSVNFILANNCIYRKNPYKDNNFSHISMDGAYGGLFVITPAQEQEFLCEVGVDLQNARPYYFCEQRTPVFKFFLDMDFEFEDPTFKLTRIHRQRLMKTILPTIQMFFPSEHEPDLFNSLVLTNEDNNNIHLLFYNMLVNSEMAYSMNKALVITLTQEGVKDFCLKKTWENVLDTSVYLQNGLRMVGAQKCATCDECKGKKCTKCNFVGKLDLGKAYRLTAVVLANGKYSERLLQNYTSTEAREVVVCSIRSSATDTHPDWKRYTGCPSLSKDVLEKINKQSFQNGLKNSTAKRRLTLMDSTASKKIDENKEETAGVKRQRSVCVPVPPNSMKFRAALEEIQMFHNDYRQLQIRAIDTNETNSYYRVRVMGNGANICHNLKATKKEHRSNNVYFLIKASGVVQKCWCSCETTDERIHGMCKDYVSKPKPLLTKNSIIMFPDRNILNTRLGQNRTCVPLNGIDENTEMSMLSRLYDMAFGK